MHLFCVITPFFVLRYFVYIFASFRFLHVPYHVLGLRYLHHVLRYYVIVPHCAFNLHYNTFVVRSNAFVSCFYVYVYVITLSFLVLLYDSFVFAS
jgi:hypothetical protein